ncbi:Uncharacterized conserved protein YloU, alkaline shock protein (Asp23) family [Sporobacter termitidis DSM 10068]|uniref:Uncharacterized conserved protein YloU, alkaline shock protein (Asp23) family n=1 Tax=Sporobacter termitidis DSM 10068 TaxID=1123282 RepID=A0A1M5Y8C8_9FIRM|nr:Asp23/Gls24 family envelope stress response protein [Sporobacter termitidis]SHI08232.1 Uncharacterized conserved protein YloU, alkaline shock protein (Asp23) family [Sporobacter termitidis DSM 10068]
MGENKDYVTYSEERGSINISEEVLAVIAGSAALEIEGVAGLYSTPGRDFAGLLGKKNLAKGVKIRVDDKTIVADLYIMAAFGCAVGDVGTAVQKAVATAIESTTGLSVTSVNVHVCGISFKKDK